MVLASSFGQTIAFVGSDPAENSSVGSIQTVTLTFDYSALESKYPNVEFGIFCCFDEWYPAELRKGSDVIATCTQGTKKFANTIIGNEYTFNFGNLVVLEEGVEYEIYIPDYSFVASDGNNTYGDYYADPLSIKIVGGKSSQPILTMKDCSPEQKSSLDVLDEITFLFNERVSLSDGATAMLSDLATGEVLKRSSLSIGADGMSVVAGFDKTVLYSNHQYVVDIAANTICMENNPEITYSAISFNYYGASFRYFGYSIVSPSNNKRVDNLGRVAVTLDCSNGEYLGRDFKAQAQLYKVGEDGESLNAVGNPISCVVNEAANGFYIDVYNFNLDPSSVYKVVVEEGQFHLWDYATQRPMHDTTNKEMVFQYRTPDEIEPMPTQSFGVATPSESESPEKLTSFRLDFEQYVYESEFYYPVFVSAAVNTLSVVDKTTGEKVADFAVDIKWDDMNRYWLENVDPLDVTMLAGHEYEVTVPEGMFCCRLEPLREVSMNKAYTVAYKGGYATSFTLTYAVEGQALLATVVDRNAEVSVSFPENGGFKVASIAFNGEDQAVGESFTTPAISEDSVLDVAYEYAGEIDYDFTTGVEMPEDCPFRVYSDGDSLVVDGLQAGDNVSIYSVGGLLMANLGEVPVSKSAVAFSLQKGMIYIVKVNNKTLKVRH